MSTFDCCVLSCTERQNSKINQKKGFGFYADIFLFFNWVGTTVNWELENGLKSELRIDLGRSGERD